MAETAIATRRPMSHYTDEEVELGLRALAIASGNRRRASQALALTGVKIPHDTLRHWREDHEDRYLAIQEEVMPRIFGRMAERAESVADKLADLEENLADDLVAKREKLSANEIAGALRNVSTSKAINQDKSLLMRGRPTQITARADVTDLLKSLSQRYGDVVGVATDTISPSSPAVAKPVSNHLTRAASPAPTSSSSDKHPDPKQSA